MKNLKIALGLFAAALTLCASQAAAQSFGAETRMSTQSGPSLFPSITAAAGTNNLYAVWEENVFSGGSYNGEIYFRRSTNNGASWDPVLNISNNLSRQDLTPIIAARGTSVAVFWTNSATNGEVWYSYSINSGASFSAPVQVTSSAGYSRPSGAVIDSGGRVHLVYYDNTANGQAYGEVHHTCAANPGAAFNAPVRMLQNDGVIDTEAPRLVQTSDDVLHLMYRTSRNGQPQNGWPPFDTYVIRTNAAVDSCTIAFTQTGAPPLYWMLPGQKVSRGLPTELVNTYGGNMELGTAGNTLHAAWWADSPGANLVYRRGVPNGAGWGAPVDVSRFGANSPQWDGTATAMTGFGLGEDSANNVHFVFGDRTSTREGFLVGNLYYSCITSAGALQARLPAKTTAGASAMMPRGFVNNGMFHMVWADHRDSIGGTTNGSEIYHRAVTVGACSIAATPSVGLSSAGVSFGPQSMGTTSPVTPLVVTNMGTGTLTITSVTLGGTNSSHFAQTNNCSVGLQAGESCTVNLTYSPVVQAGALNQSFPASASLTVASNASGSPTVVPLSGSAERSLVVHYYNSILRRAPDGSGKPFWESEAVRMAGLGANVNETWYSMAQFFYFSPEYVSFGRDSTGFVTDLYNTFFNRAPDAGGLTFWTGQIASGMPREVVLVAFELSNEFVTFTQGIFGNTAARAEVNVVLDFYRGLLSRLPDNGGFNAWVTQFRTAQCSGSSAVNSQVEAISRAFATSSEYTNRSRSNAQYVGDLYNAFLRRGGDLGGVQFWIGQLQSGQMSRETVRRQFITSPEFQGRVAQIVAQGCLN